MKIIVFFEFLKFKNGDRIIFFLWNDCDKYENKYNKIYYIFNVLVFGVEYWYVFVYIEIYIFDIYIWKL